MDVLNVTEESSSCNSTPMDVLSARDRLRLQQEEKATARLQCWCQREQERNRADRCKAYIDSYTVRSPLSHSVDPSAWS